MICGVSGRPNSRFSVRLWRKEGHICDKINKRKKQQNKTTLFGRKTPGMIWVSDHGFLSLHLELVLLDLLNIKSPEQISKQLYSGDATVRIELDKIQKA